MTVQFDRIEGGKKKRKEGKKEKEESKKNKRFEIEIASKTRMRERV